MKITPSSARFLCRDMAKDRLRNLVLAALACWMVVHHANGAPDPDPVAKARAAAYQLEARTVLTDRRWMITLDRPGKLVADHYLGAVGVGTVYTTLVDRNPLGVAHLTVTFEPKTATNTSCSANVVGYDYDGRTKSGGDKLKGPFPLGNPPVLDEINRTLTVARKRLVAAHPEYSAK